MYRYNVANMPKWLEDIKNGVKSDFDDDAAHAEVGGGCVQVQL